MPAILKSELDVLLADPQNAARISERGYRQKMQGVVDRLLAEPTRRIILLAGPSSSGKTTTASLLREMLGTEGHPAAVVSLDDFYRELDEPDYPRHPDGTLDYEAPDAIDIAEVHDCLETVLRGEVYPLPRFDFLKRTRALKRTPLSIPEGGYLIVEGLHALNPRLSVGLARERLLKMFISVSTNLFSDGADTPFLTGRKIRFMRRMSRDRLYRASSAAQTYALWQSVRAGEENYLYPFRDLADVQLDTFHPYEVGVLRPLVEGLLDAPDAPRNPYIDEIRLALLEFSPLDDALVPPTSLLREFLPPLGE